MSNSWMGFLFSVGVVVVMLGFVEGINRRWAYLLALMILLSVILMNPAFLQELQSIVKG